MHDHSHHHHHAPAGGTLNRAFVLGIGLNLVFVVIEVAAGLRFDSLALLSDAGHNLSDVGTLALSLLAFKLAALAANKSYSYGYRKSTVLASLFNALLLVVVSGAIGWEAWHRLSHPSSVPGLGVAAVAFAGLLVNGTSAWLFHRDQEHDLNARGAYLHLLADAAVSLGVVITGVGIYYSGWTWLDPAISFVILAVILWGTWGLLRDSLRLSLDGVPLGISLQEIEQKALAIEGVAGIHHLHVWAMSTTQNALTAHMVLKDDYATPERSSAIKHKFRHVLEHLNVHHATLETECVSAGCGAVEC
jgi:cobalt-zinc-cadmium efflux system protein